MKASRLLITATPILVFVAALLVTGCNGDGDGEPAPERICGTWTGAITMGGVVVPIVVNFAQDGENVHVEWTGEYPGRGTLSSSFNATYVNGTLTAAEEGSSITLRFSGNKAKGTITDEGGTANIELVKS
jgi:hypothetical protein